VSEKEALVRKLRKRIIIIKKIAYPSSDVRRLGVRKQTVQEKGHAKKESDVRAEKQLVIFFAVPYITLLLLNLNSH